MGMLLVVFWKLTYNNQPEYDFFWCPFDPAKLLHFWTTIIRDFFSKFRLDIFVEYFHLFDQIESSDNTRHQILSMKIFERS